MIVIEVKLFEFWITRAHFYFEQIVHTDKMRDTISKHI